MVQRVGLAILELMPGFVRRAIVRRALDGAAKRAGIRGGLKELENMQTTKSVFTSVTIWGAVISVIGPLLAKWGLSVTSEMAPDVVALIQSSVAVIGGVITLIGRMRATAEVTLTGAAKT